MIQADPRLAATPVLNNPWPTRHRFISWTASAGAKCLKALQSPFEEKTDNYFRSTDPEADQRALQNQAPPTLKLTKPDGAKPKLPNGISAAAAVPALQVPDALKEDGDQLVPRRGLSSSKTLPSALKSRERRLIWDW